MNVSPVIDVTRLFLTSGIAAFIALTCFGMLVFVLRMFAKRHLEPLIRRRWQRVLSTRRLLLEEAIRPLTASEPASINMVVRLFDSELAHLERTLDRLRAGRGENVEEFGVASSMLLQMAGARTREHAIDSLATETKPLMVEYYTAASRSSDPATKEAGRLYKELCGRQVEVRAGPKARTDLFSSVAN